MPTAADGQVWFDEASAVRLKGNVHVSAVSGARTLEVRLDFALEGLGVDPGISPPARGEGRAPRPRGEPPPRGKPGVDGTRGDKR